MVNQLLDLMKAVKILAVGAVAIGLYACGGEKEEESSSKQKNVKKTVEKDSSDTEQAEVNRVEFDELFANVPSPFIVAKQIESLDISGDGQFLHDYNKSSEYDTEQKMALNLGIYATDLTYSNLMQTGSNEIEFLAAILYLTDHLGVSSVLDQDTKLKFEESLGDKDKSLQIINDTYADLEGYLREERRENILAYMMAGGLIEGLYLGTNLAEVNDDLIQMISDQHHGVETLVKIVSGLNNVDEHILNDLQSVKEIYDGMETVEPGPADAEDGETVVIGAKPSKRMSQEQFVQLKERVAKIRSTYTE